MLKWLSQWRAWGRIDEGAVHAGGDEDALRLHRALEIGAAEREGEASGRLRARVEASIRAGSARRMGANTKMTGPSSLGWGAALAAVIVVAGIVGAMWMGRGTPIGAQGPVAKRELPPQKPTRPFEDYMTPTIAVESANRLEARLERESKALAADVKRIASGMRSRMPMGFGDVSARAR